MLSKLLLIVKKYQSSMFLSFCIALVAVISFNFGKINTLQKTPLKIREGANIYKAASGNTSQTSAQKGIGATSKPQPTDMRVVASKNSNPKKYHYTWCSGAKRIKLENQIWFNTAKEAEARGYVLAGNCQQ